jgi:hypothetical protein
MGFAFRSGLVSRGQHRKARNRRFLAPAEMLEARQLMTVLPAEVATAGMGAKQIVTNDQGKVVSTGDGIAGDYLTYGDTENSFGLWHNDKYVIFGASSTGDNYGFTGTFGVGGGTDYQSQYLNDNNTANTINDEFDHWKTFLYFDPANSGAVGSSGQVGSAILTIDAASVGDGTHQVTVDWFASATHDFTSFANQYADIGSQAATFTVVPGQTEYKVDVTKAVNAFLAGQTSAAPVLNFRLSTGDSGMVMTIKSGSLDIEPPARPDVSLDSI